jgi:hypothetical protein
MGKKLPSLDLFSGIGGNALGLKSVCKVIAYCDFSPSSQQTITNLIKRKLLDRAPIFGDITTLKGSDMPVKPVMITAGFPCQDAACTNPKGKGIYGSRTGLFFEIMRLVDEMPSVKCLLLENSACLVRKGRGFTRLKKELLDRGFALRMGVFGTREELGALHDRRRWICLATRNGFKMPCPKVLTYKAWEQVKEPVPRLLQGTEKERRMAIARCKLLGNSVVPQQIAMAVGQLSQSDLPIINKSCMYSPLGKTIFNLTSDKGCTVYERTWVNKEVRDLQLKVGGYVFHKWATPVHSLWTPMNDHTLRLCRMLSVMLFKETKSNFDNTKLNFINPKFIEYLMGFPIGWTL